MKYKKNALCIVAHPDDETIWMGGYILHNKNWNWTIISLCRKNDKDRMPKFFKVCEKYNAIGIMSDLDDEILKPLSIDFVSEKIFLLIPVFKIDYIFTHGNNGEYGHMRHIEISKAVKNLYAKKKINARSIFCFDYISGTKLAPHDSSVKIPIPNENAKLVYKLSLEEFKIKYALIHDTYGFNDNIFETLACAHSEAFSELV